jgi:glycosyltransferase involved in cell wall biosynthesis
MTATRSLLRPRWNRPDHRNRTGEDQRARRRAIDNRLQTLLDSLTPPTSSAAGSAPATTAPAATSPDSLSRQVAQQLGDPSPGRIWLTLAVLTAALPTYDQVMTALRSARLDGVAGLIEELIAAEVAHPDRALRTVEVIADSVVVDVDHTSRTELATGIQRVARETTRRWRDAHDPVLVAWTRDYTAVRRLTPSEQHRALHGGPGGETDRGPDDHVIVPVRGNYVLPELAAELPRSDRLRALGEFADTAVAMIGFDCVPLTSAETAGTGMPGLFARMLGSAAVMDRIATISEGAAVEYRGWREMLGGAGLSGPDIAPIELATQAHLPPPAALASATQRFTVGGLPMVLVVGSHEPRKNHLAVLHAAELLWRDGLQFSLVFIGGNAWNSARFERRLRTLQAGNRPVQSVSAITDDLLAAAYQVARLTVFPSLNEGFGLPVAESLSSGTPVVTSDFGSMRQIGEPGGALLVDPRDDAQIAAAMRLLLTDDTVHAILSAQARARPVRGWDEYAALTWAYLVEGRRPADPPAGQ